MHDNLLLGFQDTNGRELRNGDRVEVIKRSILQITDGWGRGDYGSEKHTEQYYGTIYYDASRAEFRINDEIFGERKRSRNFYEFDEIKYVGERERQ